MVSLGTVALLVVGFDAQGWLPPDVGQQLDDLRGHGIIRVLDVLYVSKDEDGTFRVREGDHGLGVCSIPAESTLRQMLDGEDSGVLPAASLDLHSAGEVGLDLVAVEGLAHLISPGTSALLMLVESTWATELLDTVVTAGGFPIVFGCLEPETTIFVAPALASAADSVSAAERAETARGQRDARRAGQWPDAVDRGRRDFRARRRARDPHQRRCRRN